MKIDKLEAGKTYKLIDKEGYFGLHDNRVLYDKYFVNDSVTLAGVYDGGGGYIHGSVVTIIMPKKIIFFELVEEEESFKLWDGEEDIKVGMGLAVVGINAPELIVEQINKGDDHITQYILREKEGTRLHISYYHDLYSLVPKPEEEFANKILNKMLLESPDFEPTPFLGIKTIAKMCYKEMMEGKDDK